MNSNSDKYKDREYDIVPYDPRWAGQFIEYASKVKGVFGDDMQIEHIGSTSVPGMSGKPCIDLLITVDDMDMVEQHVHEMNAAGFNYAGQYINEGSRLFRVMKGNEVLANVHFFIKGHSHINEMIQFRDYLRSHPNEVKAYSNLKLELKYKYPADYASYRKYKDEYVKDLIKRVVTTG